LIQIHENGEDSIRKESERLEERICETYEF